MAALTDEALLIPFEPENARFGATPVGMHLYFMRELSDHTGELNKMLIENGLEDIWISSLSPYFLCLYCYRSFLHGYYTLSKALTELARIWGIAHSAIVAFGDDLNDIDTIDMHTIVIHW